MAKQKITGGSLRLATRLLQDSRTEKQAIAAFKRLSPDISDYRAKQIFSEAKRSLDAGRRLMGMTRSRTLRQNDVPLAYRVAGHEGTELKYQYRVEVHDPYGKTAFRDRVVYVDSTRLLTRDEVFERASFVAEYEQQYVPGYGWMELHVSARAVYTISSVVRSR